MKATCSIPDCDREARHRGWCKMHYSRWWRHGDPHKVLRVKGVRASGPCKVEGCTTELLARGMCAKHYDRWRKYGDPTKTMLLSDEERFWSKVAGGDVAECWEWQAYRSPAGYGRFPSGKTDTIAARWAYAHIIADIPKGLEIDHLCNNRACVNPWHLEPVTRQVNNQRRDERLGWVTKAKAA